MSILKNLPTTLWMIGATVAVAAFSPAVGQVATTARPPAAGPTQPVAQPTAPAKRTAPVQPTQAPIEPSADPSDQPSARLTQPVQPTRAPTRAPVQGGVVVKVGDSPLGPVATDASGFTLYLSVLDSNDPPRSVCLSQKCLSAWLPVYLPDGAQPVADPGLERVGTLLRPDGNRQLTLGGWPLYRFSGDQAPGDVRGEGLKGTWHAIGPDGHRAAS